MTGFSRQSNPEVMNQQLVLNILQDSINICNMESLEKDKNECGPKLGVPTT